MLHVIITTIQRPTPSVFEFARRLADGRGHLVVAGDTQGPDDFDLSGVDGFSEDQLSFLDLEAQAESGFELAPRLPTGHYARKNIGYLVAMQRRASCIYETDDDNAPLRTWAPRRAHVEAPRFVATGGGDEPAWINVYRSFTDALVWPRGLPLDRIRQDVVAVSDHEDELLSARDEAGAYFAPIQQGLAQGAPDVDAIWRLVFDAELDFETDLASVLLSPGQWCPFNTQTTWWWPEAYVLMYVPSFCSIRMCDIWKSFVAQRCLWAMGAGVVFHAPEVVQDRNEHNLMRDFVDEVPGYKDNDRIASLLEDVELEGSAGENLRRCYEALVAADILPKDELALVDAWLSDVATITG